MVSPDRPISATPRARTTILLVDDQRFVGLALARLLDPEDRLRPDLILQDLVLPDADGLTLVATFRRHAATASTPVVVLSGNDDGATRARALAAGAADYLVKLPSKDALIACLDRHLSSAAAAEPAEVWRADEGCTDAPLDRTFLDEYRDAGSDDPDAARHGSRRAGRRRRPSSDPSGATPGAVDSAPRATTSTSQWTAWTVGTRCGPRPSAIPVMIVSHKDREEDRRRGLEAGAAYYLAKGSFHDDTLVQAVVDLIGGAES